MIIKMNTHEMRSRGEEGTVMDGRNPIKIHQLRLEGPGITRTHHTGYPSPTAKGPPHVEASF